MDKSNNSNEQVFVLSVSWDERAQDLQAIRHQVFVEEQSVSAAEEWDGQDEHCVHFLAVNKAGIALGCARLQATGKVERMAVLEHARHLGIGTKLLQAAIQTAGASGLTELYLHAQRQAEPFYRGQGFLPQGDTFIEANIEHVRMTLALAIPFDADADAENQDPEMPGGASRQNIGAREHRLPRGVSSTAADNNTGASTLPSGPIACQGEQQSRDLLLACLEQPRRKLYIYSQLLDISLLDNADVISAISAFVRSSAGNEVRVLFHSSQIAVARGHRLVELARRLESKIKLRLVPAEYATEERTYACWDRTGYWLLPNYAEYVGTGDSNDAVLATNLAETFERHWQQSTLDPELRALGI